MHAARPSHPISWYKHLTTDEVQTMYSSKSCFTKNDISFHSNRQPFATHHRRLVNRTCSPHTIPYLWKRFEPQTFGCVGANWLLGSLLLTTMCNSSLVDMLVPYVLNKDQSSEMWLVGQVSTTLRFNFSSFQWTPSDSFRLMKATFSPLASISSVPIVWTNSY
jgi:hypothetical protein